MQLTAARMFGVLDLTVDRRKLSALGRMIVDPRQERAAKADAFLKVPLYSAIYEKYKNGVLPPSDGLESEIVSLGVSAKQKERARQVFERSAEEAGFFEHGRNRLVMPGVPVRDEKPSDNGGGGGNGDGGNGGGGDGKSGLDLDPLLLALLKKIPSAKKGAWPASQRVRWFRTFAMNVSQIYDDDEDAVEMDIKVSSPCGGNLMQGSVFINHGSIFCSQRLSRFPSASLASCW